ncbi:MAG TPA: hypothetical protein VNC40_06515 [Gaiellaceae bacterium]|nr:hypothetical protein [Gaiellaceae bacterium]
MQQVQERPVRLEVQPARGSQRRGAALREGRRAGNRKQRGLDADLRCECAELACRSVVPALAETHRGLDDRFLVAPAHAGPDNVVKAADRFFVVESRLTAKAYL